MEREASKGVTLWLDLSKGMVMVSEQEDIFFFLFPTSHVLSLNFFSGGFREERERRKMSWSRTKTLVRAAWGVVSWQCSRKSLVTPQQPHSFTLWECLSRAGNIASSFFYSTFLALTTWSIYIFTSLCFYQPAFGRTSLSVNTCVFLSTYSGNWIPLGIIFSFSTSCSKFDPFTFLSSKGFPSCHSIFIPFFYLWQRVPVSYDLNPF